MREGITLVCTECKSENYRTRKNKKSCKRTVAGTETDIFTNK